MTEREEREVKLKAEIFDLQVQLNTLRRAIDIKLKELSKINREKVEEGKK